MDCFEVILPQTAANLLWGQSTSASHASFTHQFKLNQSKILTRLFLYVPVLMKFKQSSKGEAVQCVISVLEML